MANQRKNARKSGPAPVAGNVGGVPDEQKHAHSATENPAVTPAPAAGGPRPTVAPPIPAQDGEEDDALEEDGSDLDDEEDEDEDDEDDAEDEVGESAPPLTVPNDSPEVRGLLRGMLTDCAAGPTLADYLTERNDPRDECVLLLVTAQILIPPCPPPWNYDVFAVATTQWYAKVQQSRLKVWAYYHTPLSQALERWGGKEKLGRYYVATRAPSGGWTPETVVAAVDRVRRRIIFGLFGTTEEEVRCPAEKLRALRIRRLVRLSRQRGGIADVCAAVEGDLELREALLTELAKNDRDRGVWDAVMDRLNPGWRQVASQRAK